MLKNIKILLRKILRKKCVYLFLGSIISSIFEIVGIGSIPIFAMIIIDINTLKSKLPLFIDSSFIEQFNQNQIALTGAAALTVIFLSKNLYLALMTYWEAKITLSIRNDIKFKLMNFYINVPYAFYLETNPAELIRTATTDAAITTNVILKFITLFREVLILILIFSLLFYADPLISFSVFSFLIFFVGIFYFFTRKKLKSVGKILQYLSGIEIKILNQIFGAIKEIKILNKEKQMEETYSENVKKMGRNSLIQSFLTSVPRLFLEVILVMAVVIVLTIFVFMDRPTITLIPLISLLAVSAIRLIPIFNSITTALVSIRTSTPSFNHVSREISKLENTNTVLDQEKKNEIKFFKSIYIQKVNFRYPSTNLYSITGIDLLINPGKKIGFIGNSGAGKSTLIDLLLGLLYPTEGKILVDGINISENFRSWQNLIGYVPQDIYLLDDTIRKNIAFGFSDGNINSDFVYNAIKVAQLKSFIDSLPNGEETIIGNRGVRLSGGQRQRIGIARALYRNPSILVLDEATSSLDVENEKKIMNEIFSSTDRSKTLIIVTHRHQTVQNCDVVFLLDNGKLVDQGKYAYLNKKFNLNTFIKSKQSKG